MAQLVLFARRLTLADSAAAGRACATYIVASLAWLWSVEGARPDRWDIGGAALA